MSVYSLLIVAHIIGTILGVGGATFAEIFHVRAMRDGTITEEEGATLKICYTVLRIGLALLVLSGFSFLIYYRLTGQEELLYSEKLWAKMTIVFIIPINAIPFPNQENSNLACYRRFAYIVVYRAYLGNLPRCSLFLSWNHRFIYCCYIRCGVHITLHQRPLRPSAGEETRNQ